MRMKRSMLSSLWCVMKGLAVAPPAIMFIIGVSTSWGFFECWSLWRKVLVWECVCVWGGGGGGRKCCDRNRDRHTHRHIEDTNQPQLTNQEPPGVEEAADVVDDARADLEDAAGLGVEDEVEVALPVAHLLVLQASVALECFFWGVGVRWGYGVGG